MAPSQQPQLQRAKTTPLAPEPKRLGRFTVTAATAEDGGTAPANAAAATAPGSAAGSTGPPSAPGSESGVVQRRGRFTVTEVNPSSAEVNTSAPAAAATEDSVTDDCPTTPDSGSICPERERSEAGGEMMNVQDVFTLLAKKQEEMGQFLVTMRAQVLQVMTGQVSNASSPSTLHSAIASSTGVRRESLSSVQSHPTKTSNAGAVTGTETDEALNLWEALGKPIERATKRNRQLEDDNLRLREAVKQRKRELQDLKERVEAATLLQNRLSEEMTGMQPLPSFGLAPEALAAAGEADCNERSPLFLASSSQQPPPSSAMLESGQASQPPLQPNSMTPNNQRLAPPKLSSAESALHTPNFAAAASPEEEEAPLTPMSPLPPDQDAFREEGPGATAEASPRTAHKAANKQTSAEGALKDALKQVASSLDLEAKARADPSQVPPARSPTTQSSCPSVQSGSAATTAATGATAKATTLVRSGSVPASSFRHGANRVEGCTADVEGYGPPSVYGGWRSHAVHAKSSHAEPDVQTS